MPRSKGLYRRKDRAKLKRLQKAATAPSTSQSPSTGHNESIATVLGALTLPSKNWVNVTDSSIFEVTTQPVETITLCKISNEASSSKTPAVITHTLVFQSDRTWQVRVHNHGVDPKRCSLLTIISVSYLVISRPTRSAPCT